MRSHLKDKNQLRLISLGSGSCNNEIELSLYSNFEEIICVDISENRLKEGEISADKENIKNIKFICSSFYNFEFPENYFDVVLFNMSLHHIKNVDEFISKKIKKTLKKSGRLIINEYVGPDRLQFPNVQIKL